MVVVPVVLGLVVFRRDGRAQSPPADTAPTFRLPDVRPASASVDLAQLRGEPVVVNFFASWCKPCREELPLLRAASVRLSGGVAFVGVDHLDDRAKAVALLDEFRITYPAGFDPNGGVARRFHLRGLPSTVFIDSDGRIVGIAAGQLTQVDLDGFLAKLGTPAE